MAAKGQGVLEFRPSTFADLKAGLLTVNQSLERIKAKTVFKAPKTATSRRTITLPSLTVEALREHQAAQAAE